MIKTRFSPSPTGMLHLGNVRAALFSALFAKKSSGHFILRIEDTDATRSEEKFADILQNDLQWLGLNWQEGPGIGGPHAPYFQSLRNPIYEKYYSILEKQKLAYPCFCTDQQLAINRKLQLSRGQPPRYAGTCYGLSDAEVTEKIAAGMKPALRFHVPTNKNIDFIDTVKGPQHFKSDDIGDFIIRRAEGSSSFMFCNGIDDALMGVTHVLRGEDHLSNTPRQLMILQALNLHTPSYGHLSLITGDDGTPLSKRHGSSSLHDLREKGYLPQAALNYLARLSHTYEDHFLMSFDNLAKNFHLDKLSRAPARFDPIQLMHWQKEAVMALTTEEAWGWLGEEIRNTVPEMMQDLFIETIRLNILFPYEAVNWVNILYYGALTFDDNQMEILREAGEPFFIALINLTKEHGVNLKNILADLKIHSGNTGKKLFMPIRIALTGQEHGPELQQIINLMGLEKMELRFEQALAAIRIKE